MKRIKLFKDFIRIFESTSDINSEVIRIIRKVKGSHTTPKSAVLTEKEYNFWISEITPFLANKPLEFYQEKIEINEKYLYQN
jgi:hypothetical protein